MFKRLQHRFLWWSALILFGVITVVVLVTWWVTSGTISRQTQVLIDLLLDNQGVLPERSDFAPREETFLALNTESIHEMRFFSVLFSDEEEQVVSIRLAAVSEEQAVSLAKRALDDGTVMGRINVPGNRILQYSRRTEENGDTLMVFVDITSRKALSNLIVASMAGVWLVVLILYLVIMSRFSKKLVQPFVENDERQKRFITNASHELKTPLAVIFANNEMTEATAGKTKWTESTGRQVKRLQSLIEDLVVVTRLDEMEEVALTNTDFSAIVRDAAESFRSVAESSGKTFETRVPPDIYVLGEKRTLQHITSILIDNAVKYCDEKGIISIALTRRTKNKGAVLSVSNTYEDGKNADLSRFFERFYRNDESHHSEKSGFGIGLSMAKEMMERMNGKIKVNQSGNTIQFTAEI